jgi:probable selenium-dependent hydroxylase accessory protein YqeC
VESHDVQTTLAGALGTRGSQLVAFVGSGGKTAGLQRLCRELSSAATVLATTTTAMFSRQLTALGPLLVEDEDTTPLAERAGEALHGTAIVALAESPVADEKVRGLAPSVVDALWRSRIAHAVIVEADGSRGLSLKAFGEHEPQLPAATTTVVVVAGLDAVGRPLDEHHVHRAGLLASRLGAQAGTLVTVAMFAQAVNLLVARVRSLTPDARVVALLNKAEGDRLAELGAQAAGMLRDGAPSGAGSEALSRPYRVVVGSLAGGVYRVVEQ